MDFSKLLLIKLLTYSIICFSFIINFIACLHISLKLGTICLLLRSTNKGFSFSPEASFSQSLGTSLLPWERLGGRSKSSHSGSSTLEKYFSTTSSCTSSNLGGIHFGFRSLSNNIALHPSKKSLLKSPRITWQTILYSRRKHSPTVCVRPSLI
jgi:hypothetical protein